MIWLESATRMNSRPGVSVIVEKTKTLAAEITIDINSLIKLAQFYKTSIDYLVGLSDQK